MLWQALEILLDGYLPEEGTTVLGLILGGQQKDQHEYCQGDRNPPEDHRTEIHSALLAVSYLSGMLGTKTIAVSRPLYIHRHQLRNYKIIKDLEEHIYNKLVNSQI